MDYDVIRRWEAALRSGEYKQGKKLLRIRDEYCCLGVLCEQAGIDGRQLRNGVGDGRYYFHGVSTVLPKSIVDTIFDGHEPQLKVPDEIPLRKDVEYHNRIVGMDPVALNDGEKLPFTQIADCIRHTWPKAFDTAGKG